MPAQAKFAASQQKQRALATFYAKQQQQQEAGAEASASVGSADDVESFPSAFHESVVRDRRRWQSGPLVPQSTRRGASERRRVNN